MAKTAPRLQLLSFGRNKIPPMLHLFKILERPQRFSANIRSLTVTSCLDYMFYCSSFILFYLTSCFPTSTLCFLFKSEDK